MTDRTDYIIYGYKMPYELTNKNGENIDFWDDKFLPMIEGHVGEQFTIIRNGESNDMYTVFGLRLGADGENGWNFVALDFKNLDAEMVKAKYRKVFDLDETDAIAEPYLFIFSEFS